MAAVDCRRLRIVFGRRHQRAAVWFLVTQSLYYAIAIKAHRLAPAHSADIQTDSLSSVVAKNLAVLAQYKQPKDIATTVSQIKQIEYSN